MYANRLVEFTPQSANLQVRKVVPFLPQNDTYFSVLVPKYLEYSKLHFAEKTVQNHKSKLKIFCEWLKNDISVWQVTRKMWLAIKCIIFDLKPKTVLIFEIIYIYLNYKKINPVYRKL